MLLETSIDQIRRLGESARPILTGVTMMLGATGRRLEVRDEVGEPVRPCIRCPAEEVFVFAGMDKPRLTGDSDFDTLPKYWVKTMLLYAKRFATCLPHTIFALLALSFGASVRAEIPTVLTDTIKSGSGIIDVMKDVTAAELQESLSGGTLFLGADLNEDASGLEKSTSQGVAIKETELILQTTAGNFSFSNFYTNTTAMILEAGATEVAEYHTLFGQTGSSQISSTTEGFDLSTFDDVIEIQDISFTGDILGAQIRVSFLDTANKAGDNEEFFDYSAGFEDFAILSSADAQILDNADIGLAEAPATVSYTASTPSGGDIAAPSGAPEPHWILLGAVPLILLSRKNRR